MDDQTRLRRRLRAAREVAGLNQEQLGQRLAKDRAATFGYSTIDKLERTTNPTTISPHHVLSYARNCDVPESFFYVDFNAVLPSLIEVPGVQEPPDELGQTARGSAPKPQPKPGSESRKGRGKKRAAG